MLEDDDKPVWIGYRSNLRLPSGIWRSKSREEPWRAEAALPRQINDKS